MKKFRVALLANLKANAPKFEGMPEDQWADLDLENTINALVSAIRAGGNSCEFLEGNFTLIDSLKKYKPDICFNICEGHYGDFARIPGTWPTGDAAYTLHRFKGAHPGSCAG